MRTRVLLLVVWLLALAAGVVVSSTAPDIRGPAGAGDMVDLLFGEARTALAYQMYERADLYFHGGVGNEDEEGDGDHMMAQAEGETPQPGSGASPAGYVVRPDGDAAEAREGRPDCWTWINRQVRPDDHRHLSGARYEKEVLPWLWASVRCDPHNTTAYEVGAYWLCRRLDRVQEGMDFLDEGIAKNPGSHELELARGQILLHTLDKPDAAYGAFLAAERKWKAALDSREEPPNQATYGNILLYLAALSERRGELARARVYYQAALPLMKSTEQVATRIAALDERLAAEARDAGKDRP